MAKPKRIDHGSLLSSLRALKTANPGIRLYVRRGGADLGAFDVTVYSSKPQPEEQAAAVVAALLRLKDAGSYDNLTVVRDGCNAEVGGWEEV